VGDAMPVLVFALVLALIIVGVIMGAIAARKRREAFTVLASRLGLTFSSERDREIPARFKFLDKLAQGSNRYAYNILSGQYSGHPVLVFDYHYETHSTDSKGRRRTHHHHFSFFILTLERRFPELTITGEGIFSKLAQAVGYDDIDFESHEFSRKFCVRSADKKFAYDVCHARMMEYLLANDDLSIEIDESALAIGFARTLAAEAIEPNLQRLVQLRALLPNYLFTNA
jgi:hypothetical protein